jgi:hypothetical protein
MVLSLGERDMRRRGGAHQTIIDEDTKAQVVIILPLQMPLDSHRRPALITPVPGAKSLADPS